MQLTNDQRQIVEENMGLVGKVIGDKVHNLNKGINYTYDDLFQIGCIGLCKAAATDKGGCFSTYAYRLIWNEICDFLIRASRMERFQYSYEESWSQQRQEKKMNENCLELLEQKMLLRTAKDRASGTTSKGITCLELSAQGYTSAEIGMCMNATPSTVRMWMTAARRFLKDQPEIQSCIEEVNV